MPGTGGGRFLFEGLSLKMFVSSVAGTSISSFTYDAPVITNWKMDAKLHGPGYNSATTGGVSISILGINFAEGIATPTQAFELDECQTASWLTRTTILCGMPRGTGESRTFTTIASIVGTSPGTFTFDGAGTPFIAAMHWLSSLVSFFYCIFVVVFGDVFTRYKWSELVGSTRGELQLAQSTDVWQGTRYN